MDVSLELGLKLVVAALGFYIATRSPFHAFCVFLVTLPFESALAIRGALTVTPSYVALLVLFVVCLVHPGRRTTEGSLSSKLNPYVLMYLGVAVLSLVMTIVSPPPHIDASSELLRWRASEYRGPLQACFLLFSASTFFFTLFFSSTARALRFAVLLFIVLSAIVALYGIYQMVGVWFRLPLIGPYAAGLYEQPASLRPNATFQEPMIFAHFLLGGMPLLASLFLGRGALSASDRRIYGAGAVPMLLVMVVALILTIGRAAWLGAAASAAVLVAASIGRTRRRALLMLAVGALVGIIMFVVAMGSPATAWYTVANRFSLEVSNVGAEQRLWYRSLLLGLTRKYPVLGVGYGNYPLYQLFKFDLSGIAGAYGIYWQSLVETGLVGFVSLMAMLLIPIRLMIRAVLHDPSGPWRPYLVGWMASLAGLFVGYLFMGDRLNLYAWAALGFAMASVKVACEDRARQ